MNATPTGPQPANIPNKLDMAQLMARATELGEQAGKGQDTQIKFLLSCCEGAYHGAVDLKVSKHGADIDDACKLAETYVKAQGTASVFDAKAPNQRKFVSTLRTSIKLGQWPKGGPGEPLQTVNNLMNIRQGMRKDPVQRKGLDDAANTFLKFARAQLKSDHLLPDSDLRKFCLKPTPDKATAAERVEALRNSLQSLVKGNKDGVQDNSARVREALRALTDRLVEIAKGQGAAGAAP